MGFWFSVCKAIVVDLASKTGGLRRPPRCDDAKSQGARKVIGKNEKGVRRQAQFRHPNPQKHATRWSRTEVVRVRGET